MRRLISICVLFAVTLLVVTSVDARRPAKKAGSTSDGTYVDKDYAFKFTIPEDWKFKINKPDDKFRIVLTQNNPDIPADYADARDYTKIPRIVVYVDSTAMGLSPFMDSLLSTSFRDDQKRTILKEFEILNTFSSGGLTFEELVQKSRRQFDLREDLRVDLWTGQIGYTNEISISASSLGAKRVKGAYFGAILGVKKGNKIVLFHMICEFNYQNELLDQFTKIAGTLELE